ncbi:MAG: PIN domain-containing protein [Candidatus Woesearchaeota archaeon]
MAEKYYLDTCIWRDFYENRMGLHGKPLGKQANNLFTKVISKRFMLLYSDLTVKELSIDYTKTEIKEMLNLLFLTGVLKKVDISENDYKEAQTIARQYGVPTPDALHALLARNNNSVLVSQDKHALLLQQVVRVMRPEEVP